MIKDTEELKWIMENKPNKVKIKAELITATFTIPIKEEVMMTKEQIEYTLGMQLLSELHKNTLVKYERLQIPQPFGMPLVELKAILTVIKP